MAKEQNHLQFSEQLQSSSGAERSIGRPRIPSERQPRVTDRKPARRAVLVSFVFALFMSLGSVVLVYLVFRESRNFETLLGHIDQIQQRSVNAANLKLYQNAAQKAGTKRDYLRILKRVYQIQDDHVRHSYLLEVASRGVKEFPGSETLWAYQASALLNLKRFGEALGVSDRLVSNRYLSLKGEIMVRSLAAAQELSGGSSEGGLTIAEVVAPYGAAIYISLARLLREPRFAWNAALIYMFKGQKDKALSLVRELRDQRWLNAFAAGLLAYDSRDWELASNLFNREMRSSQRGSPDQKGDWEALMLQYLGDTYAYLQDYPKVVEILSQISRLHAPGSGEDPGTPVNILANGEHIGTWELYYNLASAYRELGDNESAFEVLRHGHGAFPQVSELLLLLNMVAPPDEKEYARSVLSQFIARNTNDDPYLALAALIFEEKRINQRKFSSKLWELFSKFPEYQEVLHYILWYYIGLDRSSEVDLALERYRNLVLDNPNFQSVAHDDPTSNAGELPDWAKEYMGINAVIRRDFAGAEDIFNDLLDKSPNWRIYYNMANLYIYQGEFQIALRMLRKALEQNSEPDDKISIYYRLSIVAGSTGQSSLTSHESDELDTILREYIQSNYGLQAEQRDPADELRYAKLDSLLLWRRSSGLLAEPTESPAQEVVQASEKRKERSGPDGVWQSGRRNDPGEGTGQTPQSQSEPARTKAPPRVSGILGGKF